MELQRWYLSKDQDNDDLVMRDENDYIVLRFERHIFDSSKYELDEPEKVATLIRHSQVLLTHFEAFVRWYKEWTESETPEEIEDPIANIGPDAFLKFIAMTKQPQPVEEIRKEEED